MKSKITKDGELGEPNALMITFGYGNLNNVERVQSVELGGSVLLDIGKFERKVFLTVVYNPCLEKVFVKQLMFRIV